MRARTLDYEMARAVAFGMVASIGADALAVDLPIPVGRYRATTELHGVPICTGAFVEDNRIEDYPLDGTVVSLPERTEVEDPPPTNVVQLVGTATALGGSGQRLEVSWYGPNAREGGPEDDRTIFVDLYGVYTDPDAPGGPCTGPVDLFDVGVFIHWPGIETRDLVLETDAASATIVNRDGSFATLVPGEHPLLIEINEFGNRELWFTVLSSVLPSGVPWAPELMADADEVHLAFVVHIACAEDLDRDGAVTFADLLALLAAWGSCPACAEDLDRSGAVDFGDILRLLGTWGPCA